MHLLHYTWYISTHTSRVGCDAPNLAIFHHTIYFYSHIPCGMWPSFLPSYRPMQVFLLTHPVWDVTSLCSFSLSCNIFLLTHPVWDVTTFIFIFTKHIQFLLTHPVWDVTPLPSIAIAPVVNFYSHIPCGMWPCSFSHPLQPINFYSHIPCGMWHQTRYVSMITCSISTHTSRVGCDI